MHNAIYFWKKGYSFFLVKIEENKDETIVLFFENKRESGLGFVLLDEGS